MPTGITAHCWRQNPTRPGGVCSKPCCSASIAAAQTRVTGLAFHFHGPGADSNLLPSVDRIDSDGHYEKGNIQIVCRFVNFWKSDTDDEEFRRLLMLVRGEEAPE